MKKNNFYALHLNDKTTMQFYTGKSTLGYRFITDNSGACIFLGQNRLVAAEPIKVEKKVGKKFLSIK